MVDTGRKQRRVMNDRGWREKERERGKEEEWGGRDEVERKREVTFLPPCISPLPPGPGLGWCTESTRPLGSYISLPARTQCVWVCMDTVPSVTLTHCDCHSNSLCITSHFKRTHRPVTTKHRKHRSVSCYNQLPAILSWASQMIRRDIEEDAYLMSLLPPPSHRVHIDGIFDVVSLHKQGLCNLGSHRERDGWISVDSSSQSTASIL